VFENQGEWVRAVALDPSGRYVAAGSGRGTIRIWDRSTGQPEATLTGHNGRVLALGFTPSCRRLLSGAADGTLRCWDVSAAVELCRLRVEATLLTCAMSPAGDSMLAATSRHLVAASVAGMTAST